MRDYPAGFAAMAIALDEELAPPRTLILRGKAGGAARRGRRELGA